MFSVVRVALVSFVACLFASGCGSSSSATSSADSSHRRPQSAAQMESIITRDAADLSTNTEMKLADVDCKELSDDGSEWTCDIRELGQRDSRPYFVEVGEDGEWGATPDAAREGITSTPSELASFKPVAFKGCGNRVLPPIELPAKALLKWTNPDGEMAAVRGEAVDPDSSAGLPNILSVAPQKTETAGEEFVEAGTYKGVEVTMYEPSACWTLRFTPYE